MSHEIVFDQLPVGYVVSAATSGQDVMVRQRGFLSSEDGDQLITHLEGLPQLCLARMAAGRPISPAAVQCMLVVIRRDRSATVYLNNEVPARLRMQVKRPMLKGAAVTCDDATDVVAVRFEGVAIPPDAGLLYLFSVGWRQGLYFDLSSLHGDSGMRTTDELEALLGGLYAYLMFQDRFKIDAATWQAFLAQRWFPFAHLSESLIRDMIRQAADGFNVDDLLPKVAANASRLLAEAPISDLPMHAFEEHRALLATAAERYEAGDHVSCTSILYPRIEGLMRSHRRQQGCTGDASGRELTASAISSLGEESAARSALLPQRFREYLDTVYFASFAPGSGPDAGRHSVAHGEARPDSFDLKSSTIALLVVYQLASFFAR